MAKGNTRITILMTCLRARSCYGTLLSGAGASRGEVKERGGQVLGVGRVAGVGGGRVPGVKGERKGKVRKYGRGRREGKGGEGRSVSKDCNKT